MDSRCIRRLKTPPQEFCPAAIARLRWQDQLGREPTEEDEKNAPGCPWSIRNHEHNYCFFKAYSENREELINSQIAHMLGVSEATIKKTYDKAIRKASQVPAIKQIKELYAGEQIIHGRLVDPNEDRLNDLSGIAIASMSEEPPPPEDVPQ